MSTDNDTTTQSNGHAISNEDLAWLADTYDDDDVVGRLAQAFLESRGETNS